MNEQNIKIKRVLVWCKVVKKISQILKYIFISILAVLVILGIIVLATPADSMVEDNQNGEIIISIKVGNSNIRFAEFDESAKDIVMPVSSIPALDRKFNEMSDIEAFKLSTLCFDLTGIIIMGLTLVIMIFINKTFRTIIEEGTPFCPKVLKALKLNFILILVILAITSGLLITVLAGFCLFAIYTIVDYGTVLQIESDETL